MNVPPGGPRGGPITGFPLTRAPGRRAKGCLIRSVDFEDRHVLRLRRAGAFPGGVMGGICRFAAGAVNSGGTIGTTIAECQRTEPAAARPRAPSRCVL